MSVARGPLSNLSRETTTLYRCLPLGSLPDAASPATNAGLILIWLQRRAVPPPRLALALALWVAYRHRSPPLLSVARDISVLSLTLNPLSLPPSLSSLACTPASRRASRSHPSPPLCTPYRRSTSITDAVRPSLAVLHPVLPLSPSSSLLFSSHIPSAPSDSPTTTPFTLYPPARSTSRSRSRSTPQRPTSAHRGVAWYTMRYDLSPLTPQLPPSPSEPPARLLTLRYPSSSRGYSASQHRRRRENRYYGEINMIGRRMPRYPYT